MINVTSIAAAIDAGRVIYTLSGYFGGYRSQGDYAIANLTFKAGTTTVGVSANVGHVTPTQRGDMTGLLPRRLSAKVPAGTRSIQVNLSMVRLDGLYNDGSVDNLTLNLGGPSVFLPVVIQNR